MASPKKKSKKSTPKKATKPAKRTPTRAAKKAKTVKTSKPAKTTRTASKARTTKASPAKARTTKRTASKPAPRQAPVPPTDAEIRERARQIWEQSGNRIGHANEDWFEAERQLRSERGF